MSFGEVYKFGHREMVDPEQVANIAASYEGEQLMVVAAAPRDVRSAFENYGAIALSKGSQADDLRFNAVDKLDGLFENLDDKDRSELRGNLNKALRHIPLEEHDYLSSLAHEYAARGLSQLIAQKSGRVCHYRSPDILFSKKGVLDKESRESILHAKHKMANDGQLDRVVVAGGFGAQTRRSGAFSRRHSLGLHGADRAGAFYASVFGWGYTVWRANKSGVHTADPDVVPHALQVEETTRKEMRAIRSGLFAENMMRDLNSSRVETRLRSMYELDNLGTRILTQREVDLERPVSLVAGELALKFVNIYKNGMGDEVNVLKQMAEIATLLDMPIGYTPGKDDYQSIVFAGRFSDREVQRVHEMVETAVGGSVESSELGVVHVAGEALAKDEFIKNRVELDVRNALLDERIKVYGSQNNIHFAEPSPSLSFFVSKDRVSDSIKAIHRACIEQLADG